MTFLGSVNTELHKIAPTQGRETGVAFLCLHIDLSRSCLALEYSLFSLRRELCFVCLSVCFCTHSSDLGLTYTVRVGEEAWEPTTSLKSHGDLGLLLPALGTCICGGHDAEGHGDLAVWGTLLSVLSEPGHSI